MEKRIIPVTLLVLSLCSMLIFADNIQIAYAVTVASYTIDANMVSGGFGAYPSLDYVLAFDDSATRAVILADASDGTVINSYGSVIDITGSADVRNIVCSTSIPYCFIIGTTTGSDVAISALQLTSPFTITTYNNGTTYNNCDFGGGRVTGNTLLVQMFGCTNASFRGIWSFDLLNLLDGDAGNNDQIISVLSNLGQLLNFCYDQTTGFYMATGVTSIVYKINPSTLTAITLDVTDTISDAVCDNNGNYIIVSNASNLIKVVDISSFTAGSNTAITNVFRVIRHADSLYASLTSSTSLNVYGWAESASMTLTGTVAGIATSAMVFSGNSTRINALNNVGGGTAGILYVIGDLSNDGTGGEEEPAGGNQVDGVCGNGTALECIGDRSTINQITGGQNITDVVGDLLTGLGIANTTANTDPETNGSGLFLMLITGTFFSSATIASIAVANNKFGANISYTQIPKEYWLFLVVGVVAVAFYLNWIPDIVFYGMIVGLAGLFAFGLYRQARGGE